MFKTIKRISPILLIISLFLFAQGAAAGVVVITSKATKTDTLSGSQVKSIFLQKSKSFPDGSAAIVGDQSSSSAVRKEFNKKVLRKSSKKLKRYWSKLVFSGKGVQPKVIGDDNAMKEWVSKTPNSLGYISEKSLDDSVKVLYKP